MKKLKIRSLTILVVAMFALLFTGCGGGGGGGRPATLEEQLLSRMAALSNAMKSGDLNRTMANYSRSYRDSGTTYDDFRYLYDQLFRQGGRAWFEELRGFEWSANGDLAIRRFSAWFVIRLNGNTTRDWIDAPEYFRREGNNWLIFGNQSWNRSPGSDQLSLNDQLAAKIKKISAMPPATTPGPETPIPPDQP